MTSAILAAVLLACAAIAAATSETGSTTDTADVSGEEPTVDEDIEGDFAPFMIVVEHTDGWRCSGSLVSLRTALSSAWCARGRSNGAARELWALAASVVAPAQSDPSPAARAMRLHGTRRISRVAVAIGADAEMGEGADARSDSWRGSGMDMAVMELEKPFGNAAHARPILMAMTSEECTPAARECHVTRALPQPHSRRARLLIVSATLVTPDVCAATKHWSVARERALCLVGPELCVNDWGAGVVCGGKLCGVLSRSVRSAMASTGTGAGTGAGSAARLGPRCGDRHAAQSVARWRRFLHCAHTLRACGSGRDCADLCVERRLLDEAESESEAEAREHTEAEEPLQAGTRTTLLPPPDTHEPEHFTFTEYKPSRTTTAPTPPAPVPVCSSMSRTSSAAPAPHKPAARRPPRPPRPPPLPRLEDAPVHQSRMTFEFEPNRADFKAAPTRSTRVYLKAGEYGDTGAEYGGEDLAGATLPTRTPSQHPSTAPSPPALAAATAGAAPPPQAERRANVTPMPLTQKTSQAASLRGFSHYILYFFVNIIYLF